MFNFNNLISRRNLKFNQALALVKGGEKYNKIIGNVRFYEKNNGTLVQLEFSGLPDKNKNNFFGFHIHEFGVCGIQNDNGDFLDAGNHFDLGENKHPNHSGDLPTIYSNNGYAYMTFYTNRFKVSDVIGKSVIIHEMMDDFKTDPSGNSGERIACGIIKKYYQNK